MLKQQVKHQFQEDPPEGPDMIILSICLSLVIVFNSLLLLTTWPTHDRMANLSRIGFKITNKLNRHTKTLKVIN